MKIPSKIRLIRKKGNNRIMHGKGFTMVELIVVLVILAIIAAVALPALFGYIDSSREKEYIAKAEEALSATQAALTEIYNDGNNRMIPDRRKKAKEVAGADDGSEFYVWTENQLVDGETAAISDSISSYTVKFAKYIDSDGKVVIFSNGDWTLYDSEADAKSGDNPALDAEGNVSGCAVNNKINMWNNRIMSGEGRDLAGIDSAYLPDPHLDGKETWREEEPPQNGILITFKVQPNTSNPENPLILLCDQDGEILNSKLSTDEGEESYFKYQCYYDLDTGFDTSFNAIKSVKTAKLFKSDFDWNAYKLEDKQFDVGAGDFASLKEKIEAYAPGLINEGIPELVLTADPGHREVTVVALFSAFNNKSLDVSVTDSYRSSVVYRKDVVDNRVIPGDLDKVTVTQYNSNNSSKNEFAKHDGFWREKVAGVDIKTSTPQRLKDTDNSVDVRIRTYLDECAIAFMANEPDYIDSTYSSPYQLEFVAAAQIYKTVYIQEKMRSEQGDYNFVSDQKKVDFNVGETPNLGIGNQFVVTFRKHELDDTVYINDGGTYSTIPANYDFEGEAIHGMGSNRVQYWDLSVCDKDGTIGSVGNALVSEYRDDITTLIFEYLYNDKPGVAISNSFWVEVKVSQLTACLEFIPYNTSDAIRNLQAKAGQYFKEIVENNVDKVRGVYYIPKLKRSEFGYYNDELFVKERCISITKITSSGSRLVPDNGRIAPEDISRDEDYPDYVVAFATKNGEEYNIYVFSEDDSEKIVAQHSLQAMFENYKIMTDNTLVAALDTNGAFRLKKMFKNCFEIEEIDLGDLSMLQTRDVSEMFRDCKKLKRIIRGPGFDTRNTYYFDQIFSGCLVLEEAPDLDISQAYDLNLVFNDCREIKSITLTANKIDIGDELHPKIAGADFGCSVAAGNLAGRPGNAALTKFCNNCNSLETIKLLGTLSADGEMLTWPHITGLGNIFGFNGKTHIKEIVIKNVSIPELTSTADLFNSYTALESITLDNVHVPKNTALNGMFFKCGNANLTEIDLSTFYTGQVTSLHSTFEFCTNLKTIKMGSAEHVFDTTAVWDMKNTFGSCGNLEQVILGDSDVPTEVKIHIDSATTMYGMFYGCGKLSQITLIGDSASESGLTDIGNLFGGCTLLTTVMIKDVTAPGLTSLKQLFKNCSNLKSIDLKDFHTGNLTDTSSMFEGCIALTGKEDASTGEYFDLSGIDTSTVTNMNSMFKGCTNLEGLPSAISAESVTDMAYMFYGCEKLENIGSGTDTVMHIDKVETMQNTFYGCSSLEEVKLVGGTGDSHLNNVTGVFGNCTGLTTVEIASVNAPALTSLSELFKGCQSLKSVDLSGFVTENLTDTSKMFYGCSALTGKDDPSTGEHFALGNFDTSSVTNMNSMFRGCGLLESLPAEISTTAATDMSYMFCDCGSLSSDVLARIDTTQALNLSGMFQGCSGAAFTGGYFNTEQNAALHIDSATNIQNLFNGCTNLTTVKLSGAGKTVTESALTGTTTSGLFTGCSSLKNVEIEKITLNSLNPVTVFFVPVKGQLEKAVLNDVMSTSVITFKELFKDYKQLKYVDLRTFTPGNVTNASGMFRACSSLKGVNSDATADEYFFGLNLLTMQNVTDMSYMFYQCEGLIGMGLNGLATAQAKNLNYMFYGCNNTAFASTPSGGLRIDSATTIQYLFYNCTSLRTVVLSGSKTGDTLSDCQLTGSYLTNAFTSTGLTSLTLQNLNFSKLKDAGKDNQPGELGDYFVKPVLATMQKFELIDVNLPNQVRMDYMFYKTYYGSQNFALKEVLFKNVKAPQLTRMKQLFRTCTNLEKVVFENFDAPLVWNFSWVFTECSKLTTVNIGSFGDTQTAKLTFEGAQQDVDFGGTFKGCSSLTQVDLSAFNPGKQIKTNEMFSGCGNLVTIYVADPGTHNNYGLSSNDIGGTYGDMFKGCNKLVGVGTDGSRQTFVSSETGKRYARVNNTAQPGYYTDISLKP